MQGAALFDGMRKALAVQLNNTGKAKCFFNADEAAMRSVHIYIFMDPCCEFLK